MTTNDSIFERYIEPLIPFSLFWKKDEWYQKGYNIHNSRTTRSINSTVGFLTVLGVYIAYSVSLGTPNYTQWYDILKEKNHQEQLIEIRRKDSLQRVQELYWFDRLDKNDDAIVDSKDIDIPYSIKPLHRVQIPPQNK